MAHFAKLNKQINEDGTYTVIQVLTGSDDSNETEISLRTGDLYKKCSYNTRAGIHYDPNTNQPSQDQSKAFRKNYPGIGWVYDPVKDCFHWPQQYSDWIWNEQSGEYQAPIPYPETQDAEGFHEKYNWIENQGWVKAT